jgi:hypothetical protein
MLDPVPFREIAGSNILIKIVQVKNSLPDGFYHRAWGLILYFQPHEPERKTPTAGDCAVGVGIYLDYWQFPLGQAVL